MSTKVPFTPISQFYKERFGGARIHKISVSVAETCPNREGLKGMQTCVFCDEWGSAAYPEEREHPLESQIKLHREKIRARYKAEQFLIYFQAYTNTFTKFAKLKENFEVALSFEDVVGFVVGTRPDCISDAVLKLWNEYNEKTFVSVEMGVQSFFEDQVAFLRRGHTAQDSIDAIHRIAKETKVNQGIHLIFGNPGETDEQIIETARICNSLPIHNVKLHNLHVLKSTPLEEMFLSGKFTPIGLDQYAHRVALFLDYLDPKIAVHRLASVSSRWDELVAPDWVRYKMYTSQFIIDHMNSQGIYQGRGLKSLGLGDKCLLAELTI